ncbi:MAG: putative membrane-anchored protein [Saprospiraceae bacterium]|jgi:uncharacterized membrane-anchored protein
MKKIIVLLGLSFLMVNTVLSEEVSEEFLEEDSSVTEDFSELDSAELMNSIMQYMENDSIGNSFEYHYGTIEIGDGIATIVVPEGFKFLNAENSATVLTDLWGNPPSETLGMLFLENESPVSDTFSFAVEISFLEEGYIDDDDAEDIDYEELLEGMQSDILDNNAARAEAGYESMELIGWATEPFYDSEHKKLHWAKEFMFEGQDIATLNYDIRILGRKGVLSLNVIGDIDALQNVKQHIQPILHSTHFSEGHRYSDFDPDLDEIAAYGIGGLIAGKMLLKVGFLAKFWKIILVGGAALIAGARKFFGRSKEA